ncbi:MAG: sugar transferase [Chloroflexi bacterium]|nr:sugar transferase [Chloroflexota bacterium]
MFYRRYAKRMFDVTIALMVLVLASPILLVTAALVRLRLGSPILFSQQRPGHHGRPFTLIKFRTMTDQRDAHGQLLPDADRLPRFGRFLRATSLDELPELWNVLKGEMSLVGPRPLLMEYIPRYTPAQMRRHEARPGITGWAQVNGRNALSWEEKFAFDVWYVDNHNLWLDLKIIWMTLRQVIKRDGINQPGEATMKPFEGTT